MNWGKISWCRAGLFYNDAVLRGFEMELGRNVTRPGIAGLMGAYGAALYAAGQESKTSTLLDRDALLQFTHKAVSARCGKCENCCNLTINTFSTGAKFVPEINVKRSGRITAGNCGVAQSAPV